MRLSRWLGLVGSFIAIVGTLLAASAQLPWLSIAADYLSGYGRAKDAWRTIAPILVPSVELQDSPTTCLASGSPGFVKLAGVLRKNSPPIADSVITRIEVEPYMARGSLVQYAVQVRIEGLDDAFQLAEPADVDMWLSQCTQEWALRWGLPTLCAGLVMGLISQVVNLASKSVMAP